MDEVELGVRVRRQIAEMAGRDPAAIDPAMTLIGNLAFDSLQLYELAAWLEDELGLPELREDDIASIETVGDIESCVAALLARGGA
jgi:acyl carrier protein